MLSYPDRSCVTGQEAQPCQRISLQQVRTLTCACSTINRLVLVVKLGGFARLSQLQAFVLFSSLLEIGERCSQAREIPVKVPVARSE